MGCFDQFIGHTAEITRRNHVGMKKLMNEEIRVLIDAVRQAELHEKETQEAYLIAVKAAGDADNVRRVAYARARRAMGDLEDYLSGNQV
jgi:hypothetical protein